MLARNGYHARIQARRDQRFGQAQILGRQRPKARRSTPKATKISAYSDLFHRGRD